MNPENLQVLAAGRDSAFWKAQKEELQALIGEALDALVEIAPEKTAEISEQQQIIRVARRMISMVDGSSEELKLLEEEKENG